MEDIHQGWLELSASKSKNWLKKSVSKPWKKKFFVLRRDEDNTDRVFLLAYDKEENAAKQKPKKILEMFPKYQVAKTNELKGKEFTFQVSNETESWFLAAKNQKVLDLWVIQIQMQTKLSRSISGLVFNVKAANTKPLQRIGAKDQACLLHFTRWGLTLALQESRSVLALWPLNTIRNYECTGFQQFIFEAGRRSPMGEGKYAFFTYEGDDQAMFNVIDIFVSARLEAKEDLAPSRQVVTDDDILQSYDKLHSCVLGSPPRDAHDDVAGYPKFSKHGQTQPMLVKMENPPSYDHLERTGVIRSIPDDLEFYPPSSYDQLDRTASWNRRDMTDETGYNVINMAKGNSFSSNYDHLDRVVADQGSFASGAYNHFGSMADREACRSPGAFPLSHHEPSVPNINDSNEEDRRFFGARCSSLSSNVSDVTYSNTASPPEGDSSQSMTNGNGVMGKKQRRTTGDRSPLPASTKDDAPQLPPPRSKSSTGDRSPLSLSAKDDTPQLLPPRSNSSTGAGSPLSLSAKDGTPQLPPPRSKSSTGAGSPLSLSTKDDAPQLPPPRSKSTKVVSIPSRPVPIPGDALPVKNFTRQESEYENSAI